MKKYTIEIRGVGPSIQNKLSRQLIKEKALVEKDRLEDWEDDNYEKKAYRDEDGDVFWPAINIHSMLQGTSKKYRVKPPKSIGRTWTNYVKSALIVEPAKLKYKTMRSFGTMVCIGARKSSKVWCVRPMFHDWSCTLAITDVEGYTSKEIMEDLVGFAGKFIGLSEWRPQHGRFTIHNIKMTKL